MFRSRQYRAKAAEYQESGRNTDESNEKRELKRRGRSFTALAENEEWLQDNFDKMIHAPNKNKNGGDDLALEEEHVLRCLGAAVIMQWNNIPKNIQRELFDNAGAMGDLLDTKALRGNIARFPHKHKDDEH
jgi:hypothetical protein